MNACKLHKFNFQDVSQEMMNHINSLSASDQNHYARLFVAMKPDLCRSQWTVIDARMREARRNRACRSSKSANVNDTLPALLVAEEPEDLTPLPGFTPEQEAKMQEEAQRLRELFAQQFDIADAAMALDTFDGLVGPIIPNNY